MGLLEVPLSRARELADLEKFLEGGYQGKLRPELLATIAELKAKAATKAQ